MAIWQLDLFLVGEACMLPVLKDGAWELPRLPAPRTLRGQVLLFGTFGYPWSMMEDWIIFGGEDRTRIDLFFDDVDEVEIRVRLDALATEQELLAVCAFASELNSQLFDPRAGTLLRPEPACLATALTASPATAFARVQRVRPPKEV